MKILVTWHRLPNVSSNLTVQINNIVKALKKKVSVQVVWLIYMPDKLEQLQQNNLDEKILDIHNYNNALDVIESEKPDIIFSSASYNLIEYSLAIAGRSLGVPVVSGFSKSLLSIDPKLSSPLSMFFESSFFTDEEGKNKQFMRRGRHFLFKFFFAIKTQFAIKMNFFSIIKFSLILLRHHLKYDVLPIDSRFATTLHWLSSESMIKPLIKAGFDKHSLVVTGDPLFDEIFKRGHESISNKKHSNLNILFAPSTLYEHGICSKKDQYRAITDIIKTFSIDKNKFKLTVKIHPSSANFSDYKKYVNEIDPLIKIYQSGDIVDFILDNDIVIVFPFTTVSVYSLIAEKPTIVYNFANFTKDIFTQRGVVLECKEKNQLLPLVNGIHDDSKLKTNIKEFLIEYYYKLDGKSSERIGDMLLKITKKI